jgi:hypothetical protein
MEIVFPEDDHGFALRQAIQFAPRGQFYDRGVDLASSYIGGIPFASLHFGSLSQLLNAFPFLLNVGRIMIHLYPKYCDMSHEMAISIMSVLAPRGPFEQISIESRLVALSKSRFI